MWKYLIILKLFDKGNNYQQQKIYKKIFKIINYIVDKIYRKSPKKLVNFRKIYFGNWKGEKSYL